MPMRKFKQALCWILRGHDLPERMRLGFVKGRGIAQHGNFCRICGARIFKDA